MKKDNRFTGPIILYHGDNDVVGAPAAGWFCEQFQLPTDCFDDKGS